MRNWNAHPNEEYSFNKRKKAWTLVREDTKRLGYVMDRDHDPNRPKRSTADTQDYHEMVKNILVLTYRIKDWLDEYAKVTGRP